MRHHIAVRDNDLFNDKNYLYIKTLTRYITIVYCGYYYVELEEYTGARILVASRLNTLIITLILIPET